MASCATASPRASRPAQARSSPTASSAWKGDLARLPEIVELAREHDAIVIVDDSHGTGVMGATGRGVAEHFGLLGEIDVITSTLGKALGGAAGGFVASARGLRPPRPALAAAALLERPAADGGLQRAGARSRSSAATPARRAAPREHALASAAACARSASGRSTARRRSSRSSSARPRSRSSFSGRLLDEGVFVTGFGYPGRPGGHARIRVQMSAAPRTEHLDRALAAFEKVGNEVGLLVA